MKELLIAFVIALAVGSVINGYNGMDPAMTQSQGATGAQEASLPSVTEANFATEVLNSPTPVLVDFYTDSCVHCKNMVPVLAQLSSEYQGSLKLVRVDVAANPTLAERYQVSALPGFILFKNGEKLESFAGEMAKSDLEAMVKKHLATAEPHSGSLEG